jgi:LysM repeat protein
VDVNSLSSHLTAGRDHGRLRFHPDCPICRNQRLAGTLSDAVLTPRARAGLLAAALGVGTLAPSSVASASDSSKPPTVRGSQAPAADTPEPPPGADETQEAPVDEAPQLRELLTSPDAGTDTEGEDVSGEGEDSAPAPAPLGQAPGEPPVEPAPAPLEAAPADPAPAPLEAAPGDPAPSEPPPTTPPTETPAPQPSPAPVEPPPATEAEQPATRPTVGPHTKRKAPERRAQPRRPASPPVTEPGPAPKPVTELQPAAQPSTASPSVGPAAPAESTATVAAAQPVQPAGGPITGSSYTVRPGDSLWSIARRLLGPGATAGQIAREVNRLWELNRERIGTGTPNLIHIGTVLRLR